MDNKPVIKTKVAANSDFPEATGTEVVHDGLDEKIKKRALSGADVLALMDRTIGKGNSDATPKPQRANKLGMDY